MSSKLRCRTNWVLNLNKLYVEQIEFKKMSVKQTSMSSKNTSVPSKLLSPANLYVQYSMSIKLLRPANIILGKLNVELKQTEYQTNCASKILTSIERLWSLLWKTCILALVFTLNRFYPNIPLLACSSKISNFEIEFFIYFYCFKKLLCQAGQRCKWPPSDHPEKKIKNVKSHAGPLCAANLITSKCRKNRVSNKLSVKQTYICTTNLRSKLLYPSKLNFEQIECRTNWVSSKRLCPASFYIQQSWFRVNWMSNKPSVKQSECQKK